MTRQVLLVDEQAEFERLMREKLPTGNFFKHPNGAYVDESINLVFTGWALAKTHTVLMNQGQ